MNLRKEFEELRSLLLIEGPPLLTSLLYRCRVVATPAIPTAGVNENYELAINPRFFAGLTLKEKIFILLHEVEHIAFYHPLRMRGKDGNRFNTAADCVVNTILGEFSLIPRDMLTSSVTAEKIARIVGKSKDEVEKLHVEAIYELLKDIQDQRIKSGIGGQFPSDLSSSSPSPTSCAPQQNDSSSQDSSNKQEEKEVEGKGEGPGRGKTDEKKADKQQQGQTQDRGETKDRQEGQKEEVIQEGDPNLYDKPLSQEEQKTYWKEAIASAILAQKLAGTLPASVGRYFEELLRPRVNWRALLKREIVNGLGKMRVNDWRIRSRKHPLLPGTRILGKPTIWSLIDTSGSISVKELTQFFSENFAILKNQTKLVIIPWDAKAYDEILVERPSQLLIKARGKIKGGGGTVISPALEKTQSLMRNQDIVVVFTDGYIFDLSQESTQKLFQRIGRRSSRAIFVTAKEDNQIPLTWKKVKMEA